MAFGPLIKPAGHPSLTRSVGSAGAKAGTQGSTVGETFMTGLEYEDLLVRRYQAAQGVTGRMRLHTRLLARRLFWTWCVCGARLSKRGLDILFSFIALVLLSPIFALVAALIKLEDGGPIFFKQTRVGQFGDEFTMFKF